MEHGEEEGSSSNPESETPGEQLGPVAKPGRTLTKPPEPHMDKARKWVVFSLLGIVLITILTPFVLPLLGVSLTREQWEFLHIIFPAEVGLLGPALVFYFERKS